MLIKNAQFAKLKAKLEKAAATATSKDFAAGVEFALVALDMLQDMTPDTSKRRKPKKKQQSRRSAPVRPMVQQPVTRSAPQVQIRTAAPKAPALDRMSEKELFDYIRKNPNQVSGKRTT